LLKKLIVCAVLLACMPGPEAQIATNKPAADDPKAHALYDKMVQTMRQAQSLSWVSDYRWEARGSEIGHATYRIWLQKPNYVRLEARRAGATAVSGILIGDGASFWIYWPDGKPRYGWENGGKYAEEYDKYRRSFYMKEPSPLGRHSIGHQTDKLGAGMSMSIIDPSTFHGYTDSLQPYLDGITGMGVETVGTEECDVIEASFMKHQRSWILCLSRQDHLPRKLKQVVRVSYDIIAQETWSEVTVNPEIARDNFRWSAPKDWKEWRMPDIEEGLLRAGAKAPDIELASVDGSKIKLSNFQGKIVWLNKWRCG
jgi:outer membrane lipoprotein-sorting protein